MDIKAIDHNVNVLAMKKNGKRYGMCVAWATQISADHILCAVGGQSSTGNAIEEGDIVGFSNLANGQQMVCFTLGDMEKHSDTVDKFVNIPCAEDDGAILIDGARTAIKCRVIKRVKIEGVDTANMVCLEMLSGNENDVPALHIADLGGM